MSDTKVLAPKQIAELKAARAAIDGPFSTASSMPREQAYARDVYLKLLEAHAPALLVLHVLVIVADDYRDNLIPATLEHLETLRRAVKDYVNTAVVEPSAKGTSSS